MSDYSSNSPSATRLDSPIYDQSVISRPDGKMPDHHKHAKKTSFTSTRRTTHRGHKISVRTTYRIEIDGDPLQVHTAVLDDGSVHCHGLPNYSFRSALDLARQIVEASRLAQVEGDDLAHLYHDENGAAAEHHSGEK